MLKHKGYTKVGIGVKTSPLVRLVSVKGEDTDGNLSDSKIGSFI